MPTEIERKFLVKNDGWRAQVVSQDNIRDGIILQAEGRKLRVRLFDQHATLTVKGPREGCQRNEFEYSIPMEDAEEMLAKHCGDLRFEKTRYHIPHSGLDWVVDVYSGLLDGFVISEVELPNPGCDLALPDWAGTEVTNLKEYRVVKMAMKKLGREILVQYERLPSTLIS